MGSSFSFSNDEPFFIHSSNFCTPCFFVPFTIPEEFVDYQVIKFKKNFAQGILKEIIQPSPLRQKPVCPYFTHCGGCQLQHLVYSEQVIYKQKWVLDSLNRFAKISPEQVLPFYAAPKDWSYRRHITLTLKVSDGNWSFGYTTFDQQDFLPIHVCPIFADPSLPILTHLQEWLAALDVSPANDGKLVVMKDGDQFVLYIKFKNLPNNAHTLSLTPLFKGLILQDNSQTISKGQTICEMTVEDLQFQFSPQSFIQNFPEQSQNIYREIRNQCQTSENILDLYCGIGISSLILAKENKNVTGIEFNPIAIAFAERNKMLNQLSGRFIAADVKNVLTSHLKKSPDLVIVNPPRVGLEDKVTQQILRNPPPKLIYVSCMPTTLARDLKILNQVYRLKSIQCFDMFPQTFHVETMAVLELKK